MLTAFNQLGVAMENSGLFSRALLEIEIQLDDLIQKAGGLEGIRLLDLISSLPPSERIETINAFIAIIENGKGGNRSQFQNHQCTSSNKMSRLTLIEGGLQRIG